MLNNDAAYDAFGATFVLKNKPLWQDLKFSVALI